MNRKNVSPKTQRLTVGVIAPLAVLALVIGPLVLAWGDLPDPMNLSWDGSGQPKNPEPASRFLAIQIVATIVSCGLLVAGGFRWFKRSPHNANAAILGITLGSVFAAISILTTRANRGITDWTEAADPGSTMLIATILAPLAGLALIAWLMRDQLQTELPVEGTNPTAGLSLTGSQTASWSGRASARWPMLIAVPMAVIGLAFVVAGITTVGGQGILVGVLVLAGGLLSLAFLTIRVSIDRRGLTVGYGPLPWPKNRVALETIESIAAIDVNPLDHGGWGYRGSRKLLGKAAVVVRRGDGIQLNLTDGSQFVVTVDNAAQGAGVLNDLRSSATAS